MDGFSILQVANWQPQDITALPEYHAGNALGWLYRGDKQAATSYPLSGRLYLSKSNWLLLSVPNALVRGVYDALSAPGAELPLAGTMNVPNVKEDLLNAHISVMTAEEVEQVGADKINERGHMFSYTLGPMTEITPNNTAGLFRSRVLLCQRYGAATAYRRCPRATSRFTSPWPSGVPVCC